MGHPDGQDIQQGAGIAPVYNLADLFRVEAAIEETPVEEVIQIEEGVTEVTGETEHAGKSHPSTLIPCPVLILILTMSSIMLVGHKVQTDALAAEYVGSPSPNISSFRPPQPLAWSGSFSQPEVTCSLYIEHVRTLYSYGKNPPSSVISTAAMEVDPTAAAKKLSEFLLILSLALISMALGLTIGFVIYLAWKSNYLRELRRFVRVLVDLIYVLITSVQYGIQGTAEPPGPAPMDIHEGRSSDDTANSRAKLPIPGPMEVYEGSDSDDTADEGGAISGYHCCSRAEPPIPAPMDIHEGSSDSDDDTAVIVTGPTGSWLISQLRGPREQLPELDEVQQQ